MPTENPTTLFDFADQIALVSSSVLRFRLTNKASLNGDQKTRLEDVEIELDKATASVRAKGIAALGALNDAARLDVEAATKNAEALLERIAKIEHALDIATSVLNLALAAVAGSPQGILAALKSVKDTLADATA